MQKTRNTVKVIIAGSRTIPKEVAFWEALQFLQPEGEFAIDLKLKGGNCLEPRRVTELVTGECPTGPDQVPHMILSWLDSGSYGPNIEIKSFPAEWEKYEKAAGPKRNKEMAEYADALILIWNGKSKGSKNIRKEMTIRNKLVFEKIIKDK